MRASFFRKSLLFLLLLLPLLLVVLWYHSVELSYSQFPASFCTKNIACEFLNCSEAIELIPKPPSKGRSKTHCQSQDGYCFMENVCFFNGVMYSNEWWISYSTVHLGRQQSSPNSIPRPESRVNISKADSNALFTRSTSHYYVKSPAILMVYLWDGYGHLLLDTLFPLVPLLRRSASSGECVSIFSTNEPSPLGKEMLRLVSSQPSVFIPPETPPVCFRHLLLGTGRKYLYGSGITKGDTKMYRDHVYRTLQIDPSSSLSSAACEVVLLSPYKRSLSNSDDVMALLRRVAPADCNISRWDAIAYSIREQVTLLVGASGSGMHNALYLPDNSAYIDIVHPYFYWVNGMYCAPASSYHFCTYIDAKLPESVNASSFIVNGTFQHYFAATSPMEVPLEALEKQLLKAWKWIREKRKQRDLM